MLTEDNEAWLDAARDNFEEALQVKDWAMARAVIADVRDIAPASVPGMEERLAKAQEN